MILVFTSTAFTNWIKKYIAITDDANFNPYLTFLFWAMCVLNHRVFSLGRHLTGFAV